MGKTSSGEIMEVVHQGKGGVQKITHGWFGGIVFDKKRDGADAGEPELVVIVYQRYGGAGKYAIAVASAIAEKWDEIKVKHSKSSGS